ncbi:MAG TPA: sulfatase-like hydrolase/transferase, partial [Bacteroidales bacterium]|nr:sulfatase-like hydrolase/transferase [Bacteroidales bacterium]
MKSSLLKYTTLPLAFVMLAGCARQEKQESLPNILWLSAEDIGPALGCYGDPQATTPNIDKLAEHGIVYTKAFATAPICAPARSALITGIHATSTGTQHLRSVIPVPDSLKILPQFLREAGYYCTNNAKTDYNFDPAGRWDENGREA